MPRKKKNVHTCPEKAGRHNFSDAYIRRIKVKDEDRNENFTLSKMFQKANDIKAKQDAEREAKRDERGNLPDYGGLWTEDALRNAIADYFHFCDEEGLKPARAGLALFLGMSKQQLADWENFPERYGYKSVFCRQAIAIIETQYIQRAEKYPTANLFLLRSSHNHVETSKVDLETRNKDISENDVQNIIAKLGLDKK